MRADRSRAQVTTSSVPPRHFCEVQLHLRHTGHVSDIRGAYRIDRFAVRWWSLVLVVGVMGQAVFLLLVALVGSAALAGLGVALGAIALFLAFLSGVRYAERVRSLGVIGRWTAIEESEVSAR